MQTQLATFLFCCLFPGILLAQGEERMRTQTDFHYVFGLSSPHLPTLNAQLDNQDLPGISGLFNTHDYRINARNFPRPWRSFAGLRIGRWLEGRGEEYLRTDGDRARSTWNSLGIHLGWNRLLRSEGRVLPYLGGQVQVDHHWMRIFTGLPPSGSLPGQTFSGNLKEERFQTWKYQAEFRLGMELNLFSNLWLNLGGGYRFDLSPNSTWRYFNQVEVPFPRSSMQSWIAEAGLCFRVDPDKETRTRQTRWKRSPWKRARTLNSTSTKL